MRLNQSALLLVLFLTACGSDNKSTTSGIQATDPHLSTSVEEAYKFESNGCSTGPQVFKSSAVDGAKKALCEALQDEARNNFCAQDLRREHFAKKCDGAFVPRFPLGPITPPPSSEDDSQIRSGLMNLVIDGYQVSSTLPEPMIASVKKFMEDMKSCGLSYSGPKCPEYNVGQTTSSLLPLDNEKVFVVELKIQEITAPLLFVFKIDEKGKSPSFRLFEVLRPRENKPIKEVLADPSIAVEMAQAKLAENPSEAAWARMQQPKDLRELLLMGKMIFEIAKNANESLLKKLSGAILAQKAMIAASTSQEYQYNLFTFLVDNLAAKPNSIEELSIAVLGSKNEALRWMAAAHLLDIKPSRVDLKPLVEKALGHERWDVRRHAISALNKAQPSLDQQVLIIRMMRDTDADVRSEARKAIDSFNLRSAHVDALTDLFNSPEWEVRRDGTRWLAKIEGTDAGAKLVSRLTDGDSDVRDQAFAELKKKKITPDLIPSLKEALASEKWEVRRMALELISNLANQEATNLVIGSMVDTDGDVRKMANEQLSKRSLTEESVEALSKNFKSELWEVRLEVAKQLGRIKGAKSLEALKAQLTNETDSDVQAQLKKSIAAVRG